MQFARRLYLYFISAVSLSTLAVGLTNLLELLFRWLWERASDATLLSTDPDEIRRQLSIHVALVIVSLPVWLLHWWLIERSVSTGDRAAAERRSSLRDLYLTAGLAVPFIFWVVNASRLIERSARWLLDIEEQVWYGASFESTLAILLVAGAIWIYHAVTRLHDERIAPTGESTDWMLRLYLLGAAFTGAMLLLFGMSGLLALVVESIAGPQSTITTGNMWSGIVADSLGPILVGLFAWLLHWGYTRRVVSGQDWRALRLQRSALLHVYIYLLALVGVFGSLLFAGSSLQAILNALLGGTAPREPFVQRLLEPLARAVPFVAIWVYHRVVILGDSGRVATTTARENLRRIYAYAIALVALAVGAFGLAATLYLTFDTLLDSSAQVIASSESWRTDLSRYIALACVGSAAWLWHWLRIQQWIEKDPLVERGATPRRVYLLASIAGSVVALIGSLAVVIYRLLSAILGVSEAGLGADLSAPSAIVLVAGSVLAYHGLILRSDMASRPDDDQEQEQFTFIISAPAGTREEDLATTIRAALPPDHTLRSRH